MKVAILAGGLGTRLQEETTIRPKPLVEVGGRPILWHVMKIYASYGFNEFVVALGYKGEMIKDYFLNYHLRSSSVTVKTRTGEVKIHNNNSDDWTVHLLDTGANTLTGGRIKQVADFIGPETFMLTYGDGVSNVNIRDLEQFHYSHGKVATVTAVRPPSRFGGLSLDGHRVQHFKEKSQIGEGWINGGFFIVEPEIVKYVQQDEYFERRPLEDLAEEGQLLAYFHEGFWQCMDTVRDVSLLEDLWSKGECPWKIWDKPGSNEPGVFDASPAVSPSNSG